MHPWCHVRTNVFGKTKKGLYCAAPSPRISWKQERHHRGLWTSQQSCFSNLSNISIYYLHRGGCVFAGVWLSFCVSVVHFCEIFQRGWGCHEKQLIKYKARGPLRGFFLLWNEGSFYHVGLQRSVTYQSLIRIRVAFLNRWSRVSNMQGFWDICGNTVNSDAYATNIGLLLKLCWFSELPSNLMYVQQLWSLTWKKTAVKEIFHN